MTDAPKPPASAGPAPILESPQATDFAAGLVRGGQLVGLDLGDKTIGVAVSDEGFHIASPLSTVRRKKFGADVAKLVEMLDGRTVAGWVLGLPVNMSGDEGPRCQSTRAFARNFSRLRPEPILL